MFLILFLITVAAEARTILYIDNNPEKNQFVTNPYPSLDKLDASEIVPQGSTVLCDSSVQAWCTATPENAGYYSVVGKNLVFDLAKKERDEESALAAKEDEEKKAAADAAALAEAVAQVQDRVNKGSGTDTEKALLLILKKQRK